MYIEVN